MNGKQAKRLLLAGIVLIIAAFCMETFANIAHVGPALFFAGCAAAIVAIVWYLWHPMERKA